MISAKANTFKYIDRGHKDSVVLIPGWAADYRIFGNLDLKFNYLVPIDFFPLTFEKNLFRALKENGIAKISLFGWSLGGFIAAKFASRHVDLVDKLMLVSVRKKYKRGEIRAIKTHLRKSRKGYLYWFYTQCLPESEKIAYFKKNFLRDYCEKFSLDYLLTTLDYLRNSEIKRGLLKEIENIKIIHGECDKIAPIQEAISIKNDLTRAEFVSIQNAGHMPFFKNHQTFAV